jgi:hypothetical protein
MANGEIRRGVSEAARQPARLVDGLDGLLHVLQRGAASSILGLLNAL